MPRFRKLPVEIEAVQLTWSTWNEVCDLIGDFPDGMRGVYLNEDGAPTDDFPGDAMDTSTARIGLLIPTLEGTMLAVQEDWVIRGVAGELYPCKPDIFAATYEAPPMPEPTAPAAAGAPLHFAPAGVTVCGTRFVADGTLWRVTFDKDNRDIDCPLCRMYLRGLRAGRGGAR